MAKKKAFLSRKEASQFLKVSIRTLDRYIKSNKLKWQEIDGRIWIDAKALKYYKKAKRGELTSQKNANLSTTLASKKEENVYRHEPQQNASLKAKEGGVYSRQTVDNLSTTLASKKEENVYRHEPQQNAPLKAKEGGVYSRQTVDSFQKKNFIDLAKKLKYERLTRKVYFFIIILLLSLQPIWLFLFFKN